jgi:uncharacterized protein (TIGR02466 family)
VASARTRGPRALLEAAERARAAGDLLEAESILRRAIVARDPPREAFVTLGEILVSSHRLAEAVPLLESAVARDRHDLVARRPLVRALRLLGDLPRALRVAEEAPVADPVVLVDHAFVLAAIGDREGAIANLGEAASLGERTAEIELADLERATGDRARAEERYRRFVDDPDPELRARALHGLALFEEGERSIDLLRRAARTSSAWEIHAALATARLDADDPLGALRTCDAFLERRPGHAGILAHRAIALAKIDRRALDRLFDHDRFVRIAPLIDDRAFLEALAGHVERHPTLVRAPTNHATVSGFHSGELLVAPKGPFARLEPRLGEAIAQYARTLEDDASHPFVTARPARVGLHVWGVVLDEGGHQSAHVHPDAWLSGVLYLRVPPDLDGPQGALELGGPDAHAASFPTRTIDPEPGRLVLFPSYVWHRTVPFSSPGRRISVAFDVVPAAG